ncbi:hypothetical protein [Mesorhizobium sp. M5C.F.Cr.IN.023.01.1.1]|nr:hypothetical protein [Mesorhizobium sp. M5C.F.Cr.IN.023.01.1.1]
MTETTLAGVCDTLIRNGYLIKWTPSVPSMPAVQWQLAATRKV